ncbi:MAG: 23S rRNA (uracil(1939)-C(5))-methyltransferase RlmD [Gammaproteobacteria bacterium]|jgi:23S rRNA (uracil1939-C5)-methyltransferase
MSKRRKKIPEGTFETTIESLSHDGRGITHIDGKITFIRNALPGEKVDFKYTAVHGSFNEAVATQILTASPQRIEPPCPHTDMCGGCCLQHLETNAQIEHKQQVILEMLQHFGNVIPQEILPPLTSDNLGYRHKARLGVRVVTKKGGALVGFREQNGRYLAEINSCKILPECISNNITNLRELISSLQNANTIPQIEVAVSHEQAALIIRHLQPLPILDLEKIIQFAKLHKFEIYLQPKGPDTVHKIWPTNNNARLSYALTDHNVKLQFHPSDFTQVNPAINRKMINQAIELLNPQADEQILDLFCGLGNFTIPLAKYCDHIVGIEASKQMVERGYENAKFNNTQNANFYEFNLKEDFANCNWAKSYDKLLLDPPRSGAAEIIAKIKTFNPKKILYVSCNPATFARDAGELVNKHGYKLAKAGIMDMFPHTAHVETMGLFTR